MPVLKVKNNGVWEAIGGNNGNGSIELDPTLSYPGMAADAFAVGEKIGDISTLVTEDKRSLTNAINELASSNKSAFIVTFDLDLMRASHNSTQIIEAAKAGSVVIGQVLMGDLGTLNCYLNTAIPFTDSDDRVEFITLQKNSNQIMSVTVSKDYSIQEHTKYFSTIDEITDATVGQIPVLTYVDPDGSPIGWTTVDLPEGIAVDETLTVAGAAADAKAVGDQVINLNSQIELLQNNIGNLSSLETLEKSSLVTAINEIKNNASDSSSKIIQVIPRIIFESSGTLTATNPEKAPDTYSTTINDLLYFNQNKEYIIDYNGKTYRTKGKSLGNGTYLGNVMLLFQSSLDFDSSLLMLLALLLTTLDGKGNIDINSILNPPADLEPFLIFNTNKKGIMFIVNDGSDVYDLRITELDIEIEDPVNTYLQSDYLQFNTAHPGYIKNKLAGIETIGIKFYDGLAEDLDLSSMSGPDNTTIYTTELGIIDQEQVSLAMWPFIQQIDLLKNIYIIAKIDETYQLLPMVGADNEIQYFGNKYLIDSSATDTGEDFLVGLLEDEMIDEETNESKPIFVAFGYTRLMLPLDTPLMVEMAISKAISKEFLPTIEESDLPPTIVNYTQSYNNFILKDEENDFEYIIISRNGNLVSYCSTKNITVTTPPTKTNYKKNEVFDPTGMVVTITRQDGSVETTTNYTYPTKAFTDTKVASIEITYQEAGRSYYATTPIKVTA